MEPVDVYPVGVLRDLLHVRGALRHKGLREAWGLLRYRSRRWWRSRNRWNGYLAETNGVGPCGHGWTRKRALRSLERIRAGRGWFQHTCGTIRLGSSTVPRRYCVECDVSARRGWTAMPRDWVPGTDTTGTTDA